MSDVLPINASITRIDRHCGANARGEPKFTTGAAIALEALVDDPTSQQRWDLGVTIKLASWAVYVALDTLAAAGQAQPDSSDRISFVVGQAAEQAGEVVLAKPFVFDEVSHVVLFLKKVT